MLCEIMVMKPINSWIFWCFGTWTDLSAFVPGEIWPGEAHGTTEGGQCTDARDQQNLEKWFWRSWKMLEYCENHNNKHDHGSSSILVWCFDFEIRLWIHVGSHGLSLLWAKQWSLADFWFRFPMSLLCVFLVAQIFPAQAASHSQQLAEGTPPWKQKHNVEATMLQWDQIASIAGKTHYAIILYQFISLLSWLVWASIDCILAQYIIALHYTARLSACQLQHFGSRFGGKN